MDYLDARSVGDQGEALVHDAIRAEIGSSRRAVDNLLLRAPGGETFQLDHVFIDRFGVLIVETKHYGALLKGTSDDDIWTACYRGKQRNFLQNPLRQNDTHRNRLHDLLAHRNLPLPPNYVQSLIVFSEGNIEHLNLDDVDQMRVIGISHVGDFLRAREEFQPNEGVLEPEQIGLISAMLEYEDLSGDPEALRQHGEAVRQASTRCKRGRHPRPLRGGRRRRSPNRPKRGYSAPSSGLKRRPAPGQPDAWYAAELRTPTMRSFLRMLGYVWIAAFIFVALGFGLDLWRHLMYPDAAVAPVVPVAAPAPPAVTYNVPLARQRLAEASPEIAGAITNPNKPALGEVDGMASYTWDYLKQQSPSSVVVEHITIVLDSAGNVVGAN